MHGKKNSSPIRLDRLLANLGYGTRSTVRALLEEGRVTVDGRPEKNDARKVHPQDFDTILVDGEALDHPNGIFVVLHKPAGYACSTSVPGTARWEPRLPSSIQRM